MNNEDLLEYNIFVPNKADDELLVRFKIGQYILLRNPMRYIIIKPNENGPSDDYWMQFIQFVGNIEYFIKTQIPIYGTVFYTNLGMVFEYERNIKWMQNFIEYANKRTITWT